MLQWLSMTSVVMVVVVGGIVLYISFSLSMIDEAYVQVAKFQCRCRLGVEKQKLKICRNAEGIKKALRKIRHLRDG